MLKNGTAIPFHKKLCPGCHNVPKSKEWMAAKETTGLHVFHIGKRTGYFVHWEPIFIGTHYDPLYDERLSWEGKSDKMTQVMAPFFITSQTNNFFISLRSLSSFCRPPTHTKLSLTFKYYKIESLPSTIICEVAL
jgi:hypothetical protein